MPGGRQHKQQRTLFVLDVNAVIVLILVLGRALTALWEYYSAQEREKISDSRMCGLELLWRVI